MVSRLPQRGSLGAGPPARCGQNHRFLPGLPVPRPLYLVLAKFPLVCHAASPGLWHDVFVFEPTEGDAELRVVAMHHRPVSDCCSAILFHGVQPRIPEMERIGWIDDHAHGGTRAEQHAVVHTLLPRSTEQADTEQACLQLRTQPWQLAPAAEGVDTVPVWVTCT